MVDEHEDWELAHEQEQDRQISILENRFKELRADGAQKEGTLIDRRDRKLREIHEICEKKEQQIWENYQKDKQFHVQDVKSLIKRHHDQIEALRESHVEEARIKDEKLKKFLQKIAELEENRRREIQKFSDKTIEQLEKHFQERIELEREKGALKIEKIERKRKNIENINSLEKEKRIMTMRSYEAANRDSAERHYEQIVKDARNSFSGINGSTDYSFLDKIELAIDIGSPAQYIETKVDVRRALSKLERKGNIAERYLLQLIAYPAKGIDQNAAERQNTASRCLEKLIDFFKLLQSLTSYVDHLETERLHQKILDKANNFNVVHGELVNMIRSIPPFQPQNHVAMLSGSNAISQSLRLHITAFDSDQPSSSTAVGIIEEYSDDEEAQE